MASDVGVLLIGILPRAVRQQRRPNPPVARPLLPNAPSCWRNSSFVCGASPCGLARRPCDLLSVVFAIPELRANVVRAKRMHIGFLEQGQREPSLSTLLILAKTLEIPVQTLVDGLPVPKKRQPARARRRG